MTVTPPSSDRWVSEESSPWIGPVTDGEQGWMDKRLGNAMSGVDFLDLDRVRGTSEEEDAEEETKPTVVEIPRKATSTIDVPPVLSLGMDDTLDIVKKAIDARKSATATAAKSGSAESSRPTSKKGRGVSFADEINEFHEYPPGRASADEQEDGSDEEQGQAKTPIANPAGGWMRRLEKAYSYG
jgi:hypothetical protein